MIDLGRIFKRDEAAYKPQVAAIMVSKDADLDAMKQRIEDAGFSTEREEDVDGGKVFLQLEDKEYPIEGLTVIKFDDDLAIGCTNIEKAFDPSNFESTSFTEMLAQVGVFPSIGIAKDVLGETMLNILSKAESPDQASTEVGQAISDFRNVVTGILSSVPTAAFKFDQPYEPEEAKAEIEKSEDGPTEESGTEAPSVSEPVGETGAEAAPVAEEEEGTAEAMEAGDAAPEADAGAPTSDGGESEGMEAVLKGVVETLTEAVDGLKKSVDDQFTAISERLDSVEALAKSADELSKDTQNAVIPAGDRSDGSPVQKQDDDKETDWILDTAYNDPRKELLKQGR